MEEFSTIIQALLASGGIVVLAGLVWRLLIQEAVIKTGNEKLDAIISASQKTAIATDDYIRSMSDGTLTVEEGEVFKVKAAAAIISQLNMVEVVTGKQIYNRPEVPLPIPLGGSRIPNPVPIPEQPAQPVSPAGA